LDGPRITIRGQVLLQKANFSTGERREILNSAVANWNKQAQNIKGGVREGWLFDSGSWSSIREWIQDRYAIPDLSAPKGFDWMINRNGYPELHERLESDKKNP